MQLPYIEPPWKLIKKKEIKDYVLAVLSIDNDFFAVSVFRNGCAEFTYSSFRKSDVIGKYKELKNTIYKNNPESFC